MTTAPLIRIKNASVMRDENLALNRFDLCIDQGESVAILGPNGAGKSTLLKLIAREIYPLVRPDARVEILGEQHFDIRDYRSRIGLVSQDFQTQYEADAPGLEVVISGIFSSVSLWQHHQVLPEHIERARTLMAELGIGNLSDCRFGQLSTGQQRRLLLARALINGPETLILDEPTTGMDLKASFQYLETLSRLLQNHDSSFTQSDKKSKTAVVLVTHHIQEIPPEIDRVVLIKNGKNVFDGAKQEALTDQRLTELFETPIQLVEKNGIYQVYPARKN